MITDGRKTLGVFMNKAGQQFQHTVQTVTQRCARELGYDVVFFFTVGYRGSKNYYDEKEKSIFPFAPVEKLDGILVTPDTYDMDGFRDELFEMLEERVKCPVVCVRDALEKADSFYTDEETAIRSLLTHLLDDHGFRKVCFQSGHKDHPGARPRLGCYQEEMAKRGIPLPPNAIHYGTMWIRDADIAYEHFFGDPDNWPEAVVCANDHMALALIEEVQAHGYRVPEDVVITGFDDVEGAARAWPSLTTVGQDYEAMVREAIYQLHARIQEQEQGVEPAPPQLFRIPGTLRVRESCGCSTTSRELTVKDGMRHLTRQIQSITDREVSQTYFSIELNTADSYEEMHNTIVRKLGDIPHLRDFYLCLFDDENGFAGHITPQVRLVSAIRDRKDAGMPMISFDRSCLLPSLAERPDEPQTFYVHLLHQRENTYGYTMMQFENGKIPSMFYLHWNVIISIALRNLDNQNKLKALYEERRRSSITDALTGLYNRRGVNEKLDPIWEDLCREQRTVCFASLDLDNLKPINDTFGHQGGDEALRTIADAIRASVPEDAIPARIGGDEYLIFMPDCDEDDAAAFCGRFEAYLAERNQNARFAVGASVGTHVVQLGEGIGLDRCVNESDEQMYQVKRRRHAELESHARSFGHTRSRHA
ncbi:MAG: GGDEF domain-containing protein [Clostridia bacterium]|nr:GGDEF domain-containing protein [Clostridia bacterium]